MKTKIHLACETAGHYIVTAQTGDPALVIPRLLEALRELSPAAYEQLEMPGAGFPLMPAYAIEDSKHPWWNSAEGEAALTSLFEALNDNAPEGFALMPVNDWMDLGFYPIEQTLSHTLIVPWSENGTVWHPTEPPPGKWSILCRGSFKTLEEADAWAADKLNRQPYTVRTQRILDNKTVAEHDRPSGVVPRNPEALPEEPEECEDNACAGCPWCDREVCITAGDHLIEQDDSGICQACGQPGGDPSPRRPSRLVIEVHTTPEAAERLRNITEICGLKVLSVHLHNPNEPPLGPLGPPSGDSVLDCMFNWHGGQGSALYAAASNWLGGHDVWRETAQCALSELDRMAKEPNFTAADAAALELLRAHVERGGK